MNDEFEYLGEGEPPAWILALQDRHREATKEINHAKKQAVTPGDSNIVTGISKCYNNVIEYIKNPGHTLTDKAEFVSKTRQVLESEKNTHTQTASSTFRATASHLYDSVIEFLGKLLQSLRTAIFKQQKEEQKNEFGQSSGFNN